MQTFFSEQADAQFSHLVQLSGCDGSVAVPTDEFNLVYQMTHIMRHLFDEGIGVRQMMDYYFLLKKGVAEDVRMRAVETLHRLGMERFTKAVMYVLQHLFGIEDRFLLAEPDKRLGKVMLEEVSHTGNFGQHEDRFSSHPETGLGFATTVMHRLPRLIRYFPVETLSRPLFLAWYPFWKMRYR